MSEKYNYDKPLTDRQILAKEASLGPFRKHGPKPAKRMVRDREVIRMTPDESKKSIKRLGAGVALGLLAIGTIGALKDDGVEGGEAPATTVVVAEPGDNIWDLQREEATLSGVDPNADIRQATDKAVEMNGGTHIEPGQQVILVDIKDK